MIDCITDLLWSVVIVTGVFEVASFVFVFIVSHCI